MVLSDVMKERIYGNGLLVGVGEHPRTYFVTVGADGGGVVFVVAGDEKTWVRVFKGRKVAVEDVNEMLDEVVKEVMKEDRLEFVELLAGTGILKMTYMRRAVWV